MALTAGASTGAAAMDQGTLRMSDFARDLIARDVEAARQALYAGPRPGIFWVDWREADDDIVRFAAAAMGRSDLAPEWRDDGLHIVFEGRRTPVPLEQKPGEQDVTLAALNRAISPGYEVRWVRASEGGDTLAFQVLPNGDWGALEAEFGDAVDRAFARLDIRRPLFRASDEPRQAGDALAGMLTAMGLPGRPDASLVASARYRLVPSADLATASADPESVPLSRPLAGDLHVTWEGVDAGRVRAIREADLRRLGVGIDKLDERALANCHPLWRDLQDTGDGGLSRLLAKDGSDISHVALHRSFWNHMVSEGFRFAAAFPRRNLVLMCDSTSGAMVALLRLLAEAFDPADPATLSREVYAWNGDGWSLRQPAPGERRFQELPAWIDAERGDVQSQYAIARFFDTATLHAEAVARYQRIAEQVKARPVDSKNMYENGSAAICNLADKYEHGLGVAQDLRQARFWYMRSAAMGNAVAQYSLGMMYAEGRGVPVDAELAATWLAQSAQQGYRAAHEALLGLQGLRVGSRASS
jgi:hypothetical protein